MKKTDHTQNINFRSAIAYKIDGYYIPLNNIDKTAFLNAKEELKEWLLNDLKILEQMELEEFKGWQSRDFNPTKRSQTNEQNP